MFEHEKLDGEKYRLLVVDDSFIKQAILELREPKNGSGYHIANRQQYAVAENILVERFLPPELFGNSWPHDPVSTPWWEVTSHPPHGGIVASFNSAFGGNYNRELTPTHNIVAFAENGEEVLMDSEQYIVTRKCDGREFRSSSLVELRNLYFSDEQ